MYLCYTCNPMRVFHFIIYFPSYVAPRDPLDDKSTVFELTQLRADSERDLNAKFFKSNEVNPGTELCQPDEIHFKADPRAERNTETPNSLSECGIWKTWHKRPRLRDNHYCSESNAATWKPNSRQALEWFPVPGRTIFRVDPNHVAATATVATAVGDRKFENGGVDNGERRPESESKERGLEDSRAQKHLMHAPEPGIDHFLEDALATTALSSGTPSKLSALHGSKSNDKKSRGGDPETMSLPSAMGAVNEVEKSTRIWSSSSTSLHTKVGRSGTKGANPIRRGIAISPKPGRSGAWPTPVKDDFFRVEQRWGRGVALSPVSAISVDGRSCPPVGVAGCIESMIGSNDIPLDKLSLEWRSRRSGPSARSGSRERYTEIRAMGGGVTSEQKRGQPSSTSGSTQNIAIQGRLPPHESGSHGNNRRSSSAGNGSTRRQQGNRPAGGARRLMDLDSRSGLMGTRGSGSDVDSLASTRLDCLSISSGSCAGWSAGGRNCGV